MLNKVIDLTNLLNKKFPFNKAEEWDKVGHFIGDQNKVLTKVVVALDLTKEIVDKAIEAKAEAIVLHHPFIFGEDLEIEFSQAPYKKQLLNHIKESEINMIVLHTNFDIHENGMNKAIGEYFGKPIVASSKYGFIIEKEMSFSELEDILVNKLHSPIMAKHFTKDYSLVKRFGMLPGSGTPEDILAMSKDNVQFIITSDIKWSTWVMANEQGIDLIQVPHSIESAFIKNISNLIKSSFDNIQVIEIYPTII